MKSLRGSAAGAVTGARIFNLQSRPRRAALPSTQQLLTEGGDARLQLDPRHGVNRYGCRPYPDPNLFAFGSSTASIISEGAFTAAAQLRRRLLIAADVEPPAVSYGRELQRVRRELVQLCGVADLPGLELTFGASGTDMHLIAAQLVAATSPRPALAVMVDEAETGRCVPKALAGRHFSTRTALGAEVSEDLVIADGQPVEVASVALRDAQGGARLAAAVDAEVESLVEAAARDGRRVLLTLVDVSKSGTIAPSPGCVSVLRERFPHTVEVLVDASQFRIAPATLRAYLQSGFMVALTGSKFVMGPSFSGAMFFPAPVAQRLRRYPLPRALLGYSARADWPPGWTAAALLEPAANYGLLLRWEAALHELRALRAVSETAIEEFLRDFGRALHARLARDPVFEPLPAPRLDRAPLVHGARWDQATTIFPFLLQRRDGDRRRPLSAAETGQVYRGMQDELSGDALPGGRLVAGAGQRWQLGQPVHCGTREGTAISALRLCVGARQIVAAARDGTPSVIAQALAALDKAAALR